MFNELPGDRESKDAMDSEKNRPLQFYVYSEGDEHYVRQGGVNVAGPYGYRSIAHQESCRLNKLSNQGD